MQPLRSLTDAATKLARMDADRAELMSQRDELIRAARDAGETWADIQEATGLSPRAVAMALKRAR